MSTLPTTPAYVLIQLQPPDGWSLTQQSEYTNVAMGSGYADIGCVVAGISPLTAANPTGTLTLYFYTTLQPDQSPPPFPGTTYGEFGVGDLAMSAAGLEDIFTNLDEFLDEYVWLVAYYHGDENFPPGYSDFLGLMIEYPS